jgi:hypothetical protein
METYDSLLSEMRLEISKRVSLKKRVTVGQFLSSKARGSGAYFVFDDSGVLVYIGLGVCVRDRILSHLNPASNSGILFYTCRDLGVACGKKKAHQCRCGRMTECKAGTHPMKISKEVSKVAARIKKTYTILIMDGTGPRGIWAIESMMTDILKPKYGFADDDLG